MPVSQKKVNSSNSYYLTEFNCRITIKGVELLPQNIEVAHIRESFFDLTPSIDLIFKDNGLFTERYILEEGDEIKIDLSKSDKTQSIVSMTFELLSYNISNSDGDKIRISEVSVVGIVKSNSLFHPVKSRSFKNKSSVEVLKQVASENGFSVNSKINSSDSMTWLQVNQNDFEFIRDTVNRSFRPSDMPICVIDRNSRFLITSLQTEAKKTTSIKCFFDPVKALSNEPDTSQKKRLFFNDFEVFNIAGYSNRQGGYGIEYSTFNFTKFQSKTINQDKIFLSKYNDKKVTSTKEVSVSKGNFILNTKNVHQNYYEALVQNEFLSRDFFKVSLVIHINPSEDVNLFDIVDVVFPSFTEEDAVNEPLSGKYIVGAVTHQISKTGIYRVALSLIRSGFNESSFSDKYTGVEG